MIFGVDDLAAEDSRLTTRGVRFRQPPTATEAGLVALIEDGCGNLIQLHLRPLLACPSLASSMQLANSSPQFLSIRACLVQRNG